MPQIGGDSLSRVLRRLKRLYPNTVNNLDDDCAVIPLPSLQVASSSSDGPPSFDRHSDNLDSRKLLQSVDFFRSFLNDPFTFGKIAAIHSLSDLHAMGVSGAAASAIALVRNRGMVHAHTRKGCFFFFFFFVRFPMGRITM